MQKFAKSRKFLPTEVSTNKVAISMQSITTKLDITEIKLIAPQACDRDPNPEPLTKPAVSNVKIEGASNDRFCLIYGILIRTL